MEIPCKITLTATGVYAVVTEGDIRCNEEDNLEEGKK